MSKKWLYRIIFGLLIAVLLYMFFPNSEPNPRPHMWDIQQQHGQISLLGFVLHQHRLSDVMSFLKATPEVALFTRRQRPNQAEPAMHLEAYFADVFDEGDRIIIGLDASYKRLQHIKKIAFQPELFPNDVIRVAIPQDLRAEVYQLPIQSITFVAGERLKFEVFKEEFGEPEQLIDDGEGNAHLLYPQLGLDFIQPADGLQILQFVEPKQFETKLRAPLLKKSLTQP